MRSRQRRPPGGRGHTDLTGLLAEIDQAHAWRESDPAKALRRVQALRGTWADLPRASRAVVEARAAAVAANAHFWMGDYAASLAEVERLFEQVDDPALLAAGATLIREGMQARRSGHNLRAMLASRRGDDPAALLDFAASVALAREQADEMAEARALVNLGNVYGHIGFEARALELHRQALAIAQRLDWHELMADVHHNIAAALGGCGDFDAAVVSHRQALAEYARLGLRHKMAYPLGALCERLLQLDRRDDAMQVLRDLQALVDDNTEPAVRVHAAYLEVRLAMHQRDRPGARRAARAVLALAARHGLHQYEGQAHQDLSRIDFEMGRTGAAYKHALLALAAFEHSNLRQEIKETHELLSHIAEAQGDDAGALAHMKRFHALHCELAEGRSAVQTKVLMVEYEIERVHAEAERQRLENSHLTEALAQIGARIQAGEGRPGPVDFGRPVTPQDLRSLGLTPREADVLYWVTQGKTNAEVVEILDTGLPAVKKHLGRIFEKLGVENRVAAAAAVRRRVDVGKGLATPAPALRDRPR